jgi:hypothetical protein
VALVEGDTSEAKLLAARGSAGSVGTRAGSQDPRSLVCRQQRRSRRRAKFEAAGGAERYERFAHAKRRKATKTL